MWTPATRNRCQLDLSPLMTEIPKPSDLAWLQLLRPRGQAMAPGPQADPRQYLSHAAITHQRQSSQTLHRGRRTGSVRQPSQDRGAAWGSQPCAQPTCSSARTQLAAQLESLQAMPAPLHSAEVPQGAWGTSPRGRWQWGSGRRAAHPTAGTRDILGKLRWTHFSEWPSPAGSSIHLIWGLISLRHNHETVNTSLHPSESLMDN